MNLHLLLAVLGNRVASWVRAHRDCIQHFWSANTRLLRLPVIENMSQMLGRQALRIGIDLDQDWDIGSNSSKCATVQAEEAQLVYV